MCKSTELINYVNFDFTNNNTLCMFDNTSVRRMNETTLAIRLIKLLKSQIWEFFFFFFEVTTQSK